MSYSILLIDDEKEFLSSAKRALITAGFHNITLVSDPTTVAGVLSRNGEFDIAMIDITMPVMDGMEVLALIKNTSPSTECIMVTARDEARIAVECLRKGAYDYLVKPLGAEDFLRVVEHALERKRLLEIVELNKLPPGPVEHAAFQSIITGSSSMYTLMKEAELHAKSEIPVLISGETGTGKELLARAIHAVSPRAGGPFTAINMASLSESLFESAFFGHAKGAFTSAQNEHMGFLEATAGGTVFLDEIGTLPNGLQGKLLRVLQEKEYIKLGTSRSRSANVRFVAATNADLRRLLADHRFRKDLYYRLRGAQLHLPPLRQRKEDIPGLIHHFLAEFRPEGSQPQVTEEAMALLMAYEYPGNIRELKAVIQAAVNLCGDGEITAASLPGDILRNRHDSGDSGHNSRVYRTVGSLAEMEKDHIRSVVEQTGGNLTHSARQLGIALNTLRKKLQLYGIERK